MSDLASRQNLKILFALSEEITSLDDVLLNGVSIVGQEIAFAYTKGGVDQKAIPGFDTVISSSTPGTSLLQAVPLTYLVTVVGSKSPEAVEVGIYCPEGIYWKDAQGSMLEAGVELSFAVRIQGAPSFTPLTKRYLKNGKIPTAYRSSVLIQRPDFIPETSAWEIQVTRVTMDAADAGTADLPAYIGKTTISFITHINTSGRTYAGTAMLAVWVEDISLINNQFPQAACKAKGMKFLVPKDTHYNPTTRAYTLEAWDGTFNPIKQYTPNIGWQLLSILSDQLTKTIPINAEGTRFYTYMYSFGVPISELGLWSFYSFAKYCDETFNGLPRYEFNKQFVEKLPRRQFVDALLSVGNARLCRKHGLLCIAYDRYLSNTELAKVPLFIPEMTDDGFETSDTHLSERYTHMAAIYEDLHNNNVVATVQADSTDLMIFLKSIGWYPPITSDMLFVDQFGYKATSVDLAGATNYNTALIKARGLLWDSLIGNEFVSFTGGLEFSTYYEGQVIGILDTSLSLAKKAGRIVSFTYVGSLYTIVLDAPISLATSDFVYLNIKNSANFTSEQLTSTEALLTLYPVKKAPHTSNFAVGETTKVSDTWIFSLTDAPIDNSPFLKASNEITYWTITDTDLSDGRITIKAKIYHQEKFAFMEDAYTKVPLTQQFTSLPKVTAITPTIAIHEGMTSTQILIEIVFNHEISLTIAQTHAIVYDITCTFFDGSSQTQRLIKSMSTHEIPPGTIVAGEILASNLPGVTNALLTSMDHFVSFSFMYQNFKQYFKNALGTYDATFPASLTISVQASVYDLLSGISPSPPAVYKNTVTLAKPADSAAITVG